MKMNKMVLFYKFSVVNSGIDNLIYSVNFLITGNTMSIVLASKYRYFVRKSRNKILFYLQTQTNGKAN